MKLKNGEVLGIVEALQELRTTKLPFSVALSINQILQTLEPVVGIYQQFFVAIRDKYAMRDAQGNLVLAQVFEKDVPNTFQIPRDQDDAFQGEVLDLQNEETDFPTLPTISTASLPDTVQVSPANLELLAPILVQ